MDRNQGIALLMEEVVRSAYRARRSKDIQSLQWSILRFLSQFSNDSRSLAAIAAYVGVTDAPASRAVKTLEKRGLVKKENDCDDRRFLSIAITHEGMDALRSDPMLQIAYKLSALSDVEIIALSDGLRRLVLSKEETGWDGT